MNLYSMIYDLSNNIDKNKAAFKLDELIKSGKVIELTEKQKKRSIRQNSYLHVAITLFAIEVGYNLEEAKTTLKRECKFMRYSKDGNVFLKRTRDLTTKELTDFIEFILNFAGEQGIYIPTSEEYIQNYIEIDKTIAHNKIYL